MVTFAEQSKNMWPSRWCRLTESIKGNESLWSVEVGFVCTSGPAVRKANEKMGKSKATAACLLIEDASFDLFELVWIPNYFGKLESCPHFLSLSANQDFDLVDGGHSRGGFSSAWCLLAGVLLREQRPVKYWAHGCFGRYWCACGSRHWHCRTALMTTGPCRTYMSSK